MREYAGSAFHPDFEQNRRSGTLSVGQGQITFVVDDVTLTLPLQELDISMGGAGKRLIYFSNPTVPDVTFYTADRAILKDPDLSYHPACSQALGGVRRGRRNRRLATLGLLVLAAAAILAPFLFIDGLIRAAAERIPFEWEAQLGTVMFDSVTQGQTFVTQPELLEQLERLTRPLVAVVNQDNPEYTFEFHIVEDATLNAFALPGGQVVIHTGLLLAAERPEEVAGVLAHEISHVTCRHHLRGILKRAGITAVAACLIGDIGSVSDLLIGYGSTLAILKNSRTFEYEADAVGWDYLVRARIDATGMIEFFQRLQDHSGDAGDLTDQLDFLSTHPATADRIKELESRPLPEKSQYYQFEMDFTAFQQQLRNSTTQPSPDSPAGDESPEGANESQQGVDHEIRNQG